MIKTDVVILGGGVIGLSIALKMLNAGREVILLDPKEPGTGTSYGNAGTIAEYAVLPVGSPEIIKKIPSLLFNKNSPISVKRSEILSLAPWLIRFLYQSMPKQAAKNAQAITDLLVNSRYRWEELADQINGKSLLNSNGNIYLYKTDSSYESGLKDINNRKKYGVNAEMLNPSELNKLEPNLNFSEGGASYFPDGAYMSDPGKMTKLLLDAMLNMDAKLLRMQLIKLRGLVKGLK